MAQDQKARRLVEKACVDWEADLKLFLLGVLRDRHLADEAFQRTVLSALRAADSANAETLRGWLFRIALNEARQLRRSLIRESERRAVVGQIQQSAWHSGTWTESEAAMVTAETVERIHRSLSRLPENYQSVVRRRIFDGQTFASIAEDLQIPLGTVLTWMRRALLRLKEDQDLQEL